MAVFSDSHGVLHSYVIHCYILKALPIKMSIHFFHSSQPSIFIWGPGYFKATFQNPSVLGEAHLAVLDPFNLVALHLLTGKPAVSERLATYTHPNEY